VNKRTLVKVRTKYRDLRQFMLVGCMGMTLVFFVFGVLGQTGVIQEAYQAMPPVTVLVDGVSVDVRPEFPAFSDSDYTRLYWTVKSMFLVFVFMFWRGIFRAKIVYRRLGKWGLKSRWPTMVICILVGVYG
jgi:hypothetical protein